MLKRYSLGGGHHVARTIVIVAFPCSRGNAPKETRGVGLLRRASASVVQGSGIGGLVRRKFARRPVTIAAPNPMTRTHGRIARELCVEASLAGRMIGPTGLMSFSLKELLRPLRNALPAAEGSRSGHALLSCDVNGFGRVEPSYLSVTYR